MSPAEAQRTADTVLQRIACLSARDASKRFDNVMHLFNQESLAMRFRTFDGRKAVGADGVTNTWETFRSYIDRHPLPRQAVYHALYCSVLRRQ